MTTKRRYTPGRLFIELVKAGLIAWAIFFLAGYFGLNLGPALVE